MIRLLRLLPILLLTGAAAIPARAGTRPDQVLVLYNKDWKQDLDGSAPGQDSEELARYYVKMRTDPATGRKPWLLGLTAGGGPDSPLNRPVLRENSSDNRLGLEYRGKDPLIADPWILSTTRGDATVPVHLLVAARAHPRFAAAWLSRKDLAKAHTAEFEIMYTAAGQKPVLLADVRAGQARKSPAVSMVGTRLGTLILVDLFALPLRRGALRFLVERTGAAPIDLSLDLAKLFPTDEPKGFTALKGHRSPLAPPPAASTVLPRLLSILDILALSPRGTVSGILLKKEDLDALEPGTLVVRVASRLHPKKGTDLYRAADGFLSPVVNAFRLKGGGLLLSGDLSMKGAGSVQVTCRGKRKGCVAWKKDLVLFDPRDFRISKTGPDGVRDDATYLRLIANPVKRFLETHKTKEGIPLKDHVLYIVVVHGLPLQVRSMYGVSRGVTNGRPQDLGTGSSLTQRIQTLYYDPVALGLRPTIIVRGKRGGIGTPTIANPLTACLTGPMANPYLHPLAHRGAREKEAWEKGGIKGLRELDPPHFSTSLRSRVGAARFLYGSGRIDGRSIETAKSRIDAAIYAEHYLTPKLGPSFVAGYQEAPLTAEELKARGFDVRPATGHAKRVLFYFGVFGYGADYEQDIGANPTTSLFWEDGFLPGGIGYAIRSFLGWDRNKIPSDKAQLFEQILRGGPTVTAGSAGGAHDTNLTWPDSLILTHLLFDGYDLGDALLRSEVYLDWTLSEVGDPLYCPDLSKTKPDTTPPKVSGPKAIHAEVLPDGPGTFALRIRVDLANTDPEMAETEIRCWPVGRPKEGRAGRNPRFSARPTAFVDGLEPETTYGYEVVLTDPYGNRFDSEKQFGPAKIDTPKARPVRVVQDRRFLAWKGRSTLPLFDADMDDSGEIDVTFSPKRQGGMPVFRTRTGRTVFDGKELTIGGARTDCSRVAKLLKPDTNYRILIRWRRFPTTREAYLVAPDGTTHVFATGNDLPWDPARKLGPSLVMTGAIVPKHVVIRDDAEAAPSAHRTALPLRFDPAAFRAHGGVLTK